ncbi:MAG: MotA/TolQ/ExbB proton channel family protein [Myxococcota bacterium]
MPAPLSALFAASVPPALIAKVDLIELLTSSRGIVLGVVILLLLLVALCIFVIIFKFIQITMAQSQSVSFLDKFWQSKRLDDIYRVAEGAKSSPIAAMFRAGYIELSKVKKQQAADGDNASMHDKMGDSDNVERALARAKLAETTKLENLLPFLATTGSAAPFIGLFGTVFGIMEAFLNIAAAGQAELSEVSQPIAEALVTTALALASAVPAVVAYNYFQRRLKVLGSEMTNFGSDFMNIVKRHFF